MEYKQPYLSGTLIKRYKRFLADVELENGEIITVHTPNTGSMKGCAEPRFKVWIYDSQNDKRKYRYSWLLVENDQGVKIGINTAVANGLVQEAVENGVISQLQSYGTVKREVTSPTKESRFDLFLQDNQNQADCFVEVKSVTAIADQGMGIFPDAVSARGTKHLQDLVATVERGFRGALVFCVQREDVKQMRAAKEIDPVYAEALKVASAAGVEIYAYLAELSPEKIALIKEIPVIIDPN